MKKNQSLGTPLSKSQQKQVSGGMPGQNLVCNDTPNGAYYYVSGPYSSLEACRAAKTAVCAPDPPAYATCKCESEDVPTTCGS